MSQKAFHLRLPHSARSVLHASDMQPCPAMRSEKPTSRLFASLFD